MRPEDVPADLVEKAARAMDPGAFEFPEECAGDIECARAEARHAVAAVLPEIKAAARKELIDDLTWLADAREEYAHGDVIKETDAVRVALGVAQGEPAWGWLPSWRWDEWKTRAARLTASPTVLPEVGRSTTEEPT